MMFFTAAKWYLSSKGSDWKRKSEQKFANYRKRTGELVEERVKVKVNEDEDGDEEDAMMWLCSLQVQLDCMM